ncbi:MAG: hypothetical protein KC657_32500 [Myxococcales bacterium]|nr:hypothetical protein [Myxococcales bacterium]
MATFHHAPHGHMGLPAAKRNVALITIGIVLAVVALIAGFFFVINLHQYLTVEDRWAADRLLSPSGRAFGVRLIKAAAMKRMTLFGPVSGLSGITGLVLFVLGMRKR